MFSFLLIHLSIQRTASDEYASDNKFVVLQALEAEIQSHEPVISTVNSRAQQMIRSGHFASADIEAKIKQLLMQLSQLKDTASLRRLRLLDAVESQMVSGNLWPVITLTQLLYLLLM